MFTLSKSHSVSSIENYHLKDNQGYYKFENTYWGGKLAAKWGLLDREVTQEIWSHLINGRDPSGNRVIQNGVGKGGKALHIPTIEGCFSLDKTSTLMSLFDESIKDYTKKSVINTMRHVEDLFSWARITEDRITTTVNTGNLIWCGIPHEVSRSYDPQYHIHVPISNMTKRPDGEIRALYNPAFFAKDIKKFIGQIFRSYLAKELKEFVYNFSSDNNGFIKFPSFREDAIDHFSKRRVQTLEKAKQLRTKYPDMEESKLLEKAVLGSRAPKQNVDINDLKKQWMNDLEVMGYTKEKVLEKAFSKSKIIESKPFYKVEDYIKLSANSLTQRESEFTDFKLLTEAMKLSMGVETVDTLQKSINSLLKNGELVFRKHENCGRILTTPDILRMEHGVKDYVLEGSNSQKPLYSENEVLKRLSGNSLLNDDQRNAVKTILTSTDSVIGISGKAGTGKTTFLSAVNEIAKEKVDVIGLAFTGKASHEMQAIGIKSMTIDYFLNSSKNISLNKDKVLFLLDEASTISSQKMSVFIDHIKNLNPRIVLVGDSKQMKSIGAGDMFSRLQESGMKTVHLSKIIRQSNNEEYLSIVENVSEKKIDNAFIKITEAGKIQQIESRNDRISATVDSFLKGKYQDKIIVTQFNRDKNDINSIIHERLKIGGKISRNEYIATVREIKGIDPINKMFSQNYSEGDLIIS